ncbi:CLUMA_CG017667, isoform A [Clunio marinus]|uniref:CLUMA_CG017667, isoform A n=1 Tax=Clunio marinus TaxID=568069 RepID=A0A1J1IWR4_9DIPT|nr:CLUMA_CG017667, isoform A [Clunio marinus]
MIVTLVILAFANRCYGTFTIDNLQPMSSDLVDAASEIISNHFKSNAVTINFISALTNETKCERSFLINNLIAQCDVVFVEDIDVITKRHRLYNVIFIDTFQSFLRLFRRLTSKYFVIDGYFLMIFINGPIDELGEITKSLWNNFIFNVAFLAQTEYELNISTFIPFSKPKCDNENCIQNCGDTKPVVIDVFNKTFTKNKDFFPNKMENFFNCPVKVVTFNCPPMMMIKYDEDKNFDFKGPDGEMLKLLSKKLNFKIDLIHISDLIRWGALYENGTSKGAIAMVINKEADLTLGMYTITYLRTRFMTSSHLYYSVPFIVIVPPGAPLSPFEKLFRPFQIDVWTLLLITFATAVGVVTFVKFQSPRVRNFVFGAGNRSPYLNILNAFVGGSLTSMPTKNFARTLLMMFFLFSIVKRTLYQGALFQFLQSDDRSKEVQSIDELVEEDFDVYMMASSLEHTQNMKFRDQRVVVTGTVLEERKRETSNPRSKFAVTSSFEQILYFNKMNYKTMTLTVCKEYLFTFQYGIYMRKNSYLEQAFNKQISSYKTSGLIDFWASFFIDMKFFNMKMSYDGPRKLSIEQLLGGFELLFFGYVIGFIIYIFEILSKRMRLRRLQRIIEFFT